jgi:hypothetical protein
MLAAGSVMSYIALRWHGRPRAGQRTRVRRTAEMTTKSWADLIAEARDALAAAERELAHAERERPGLTTHDPLAATLAELAALDAAALEQVRDDAEAAINRYVIAAATYNRVLDELREELVQHGLDRASIEYHDLTGQSGVRVNDIVKLRARPRETLMHLAHTALATHLPEDGQESTAPAEQPGHTRNENGLSHQPVAHAVDVPPASPANVVTPDQLAAMKDDWLAPLLEQLSRQASEIEGLYGRLDLQQEHIDHLREQLTEQADVTTRITSFLNVMRQAQEQLR